jgi:hypothetical protein
LNGRSVVATFRSHLAPLAQQTFMYLIFEFLMKSSN